MSALPALNFNTLKNDTVYPPKKPPITEAEYWDKYYHYPDITYEWNNGKLEEKGVSDVLTVLMYKWFLELLEHYLRTHPIAQSMVLEMGFRLSGSQKQKSHIRRPDLGVVLNSNPVPLLPHDKSYQGIYDLCIEAISDSEFKEIKRDIQDKKIEYAKAGVTEYYILDGHDRYTAFYRLNQKGDYAPIKPLKGDIIQSTVLPGFQFRITDLLNNPSPDDMIDDLVYQRFVLPGYRQEKQARLMAEKRAGKQEKQINAEKQARLVAEKRAEQLADKLRSLGINPDDI